MILSLTMNLRIICRTDAGSYNHQVSKVRWFNRRNSAVCSAEQDSRLGEKGDLASHFAWAIWGVHGDLVGRNACINGLHRGSLRRHVRFSINISQPQAHADHMAVLRMNGTRTAQFVGSHLWIASSIYLIRLYCSQTGLIILSYLYRPLQGSCHHYHMILRSWSSILTHRASNMRLWLLALSVPLCLVCSL